MTAAQMQGSRKQRFWTTWQAFVGIPGIPLLGWGLFAPEDLRLPYEHVTVIWLALFVVGAVAGLIRLKVFPGREVESSRTVARAPAAHRPKV